MKLKKMCCKLDVIRDMRKMEQENIETKVLMLREDAEYCCVNMKTIYRKIKKGENQKIGFRWIMYMSDGLRERLR
jgi:hypothetical protein